MLLAAIFAMIGCEKSEMGEEEVEGKIDLLHASEKLLQVYANVENPGMFTFEATAPWKVNVIEIDPAATSSIPVANDPAASWVRLFINGGAETYAGQAGKYNLVVRLEQNTSGVDRSASIDIRCGRDRVAFTITQLGKNKPEPAPITKYSRYIGSIEYLEGEGNCVLLAKYIFHYDQWKRIWGIDYKDNEFFTTYRFNYVDENTIETVINSSGLNSEIEILTLNDAGALASVWNVHDSTKSRTYHYEKGYLSSVVYGSGCTETVTWQDDGTLLTYIPCGEASGPTYYYTSHTNRPGINIDLNALFTREFDIYSLLDLTGKRSGRYVAYKIPWEVDGEYSDQGPGSAEKEYLPLEYQFYSNGYVHYIIHEWTEKKNESVHAAGDRVFPPEQPEVANQRLWIIK